MKKVLIITYYWPPAGGPGVQRWLKFCTYLKEYGIQPIVYIPENPNYPITDMDIMDEVPKDLIFLKKKIIEPYALASKFGKKDTATISKGVILEEKMMNWKQKMLLWVRGNLFIPDARKLWVLPSVNFLKKEIQLRGIDTVITTGPPHSLHLIGKRLKEMLPITWITDFRDPWTTIGYHSKMRLTSYAAKRHLDLEQQVLQASDHIIVTSQGTKQEFTQKTQKPITVITNGYEPQKKLQETPLDRSFSIAHIGSLLSERNPIILWQVISELLNEYADFRACFQLTLAGVVSEQVLKSIVHYQLTPYVRNLGYISHSKALQLQRASQVLLLIEIDSKDTQQIIPGKLFEYLQSSRPILAIGPNNSEIQSIITETQTGSFFLYSQKKVLKQQLLTYFKQYQQKSLKVYPNNIDQYTRKRLTEKLAALIHSK